MLRWEQSRLAEKAGVPVETIERLEPMEGPLQATKVSTVSALQAALEAAGIEFTDGEKPGVRRAGSQSGRS